LDAGDAAHVITSTAPYAVLELEVLGRWPAAAQQRRSVQHGNAHGKPSSRPLLLVVVDRLARGERPKPITYNRGVVHEHLAAVGAHKEPVALGVVEPLDRRARHKRELSGRTHELDDEQAVGALGDVDQIVERCAVVGESYRTLGRVLLQPGEVL